MPMDKVYVIGAGNEGGGGGNMTEGSGTDVTCFLLCSPNFISKWRKGKASIVKHSLGEPCLILNIFCIITMVLVVY